MERIQFDTTMSFMQKMFGHFLDEELYSYYWIVFKNTDYDLWEASVKETITSFVPTSQVPFPAIAILKKNIPETKTREPMYLAWHGFNVKDSELPTPEEIENFIDSLPPVFRPTNRTSRNGKIEKMGDIQ